MNKEEEGKMHEDPLLVFILQGEGDLRFDL
jgi:hypothetical protein